MASNYPTVLDDSTSLMAVPGNRQVYTLDMTMPIDELEFYVDRLILGVNVPTYMVFQGGEIVLIDSYDSNIFYVAGVSGRGVLGSRIQPHRVGERVLIGLLSPHINQIKYGLIASERHQGCVGLDVDKGAFPDPGQRYTALDTGKIYYCFQPNVWTWVNKVSHANLTGLSDDDHPHYHTAARANSWHSSLSGAHITGGNDHTHIANAPVTRIAQGWDIAKPETPLDGQIYFSTNLDGGTLFIGLNGVWQRMVGIPAGGIAPFNGPCPAGWTRYTALDGKYPLGSIVAEVGQTGGGDTHRHAFTAIMKHYHTINATTLTSTSAGGHSHSLTIGSGSVGNAVSVPAKTSYAGGTEVDTNDAGGHNHTAVVPQINTGSTGYATGYTDYESSIPVSREVIWCKKD